MENDYSFKICIFGDGGVGKTSLTNRYLTGRFNPDISMTLGANILVKSLEIAGKKISLQIWDFGGEDMFKFLLPSYSVGSSGGIFMFDMTRVLTLMNVKDWLSTFESNLIGTGIPILLVGGKTDLGEQQSVSHEDIEKIKKEYNFFDFIGCSAKTGDNVDLIFRKITEVMLKNVNAFQF